MLVEERHEKILQIVNDKGSILVSELSKFFKVTQETIRRDLNFLETAGLLRRLYGGAVSLKNTSIVDPFADKEETPYTEREVLNVEEKKRIAIEAIKWVRPHDRIILDASTTAWYMASYLPDMPMTVLTNSALVVRELINKREIEVINTGGKFLQRSLSYIGPLAERALEGYHVDKLFLSCKGVDIERGVSDSNDMQAIIKRKMISITDKIILLADSSKFGVKAFTHVVDLQVVDEIITDTGILQGTLKKFTQRGVHVKVV